ncbi:MAG: hypothetical protein ACLQAT_03505 [Candidatus Binataceae bacterium]
MRDGLLDGRKGVNLPVWPGGFTPAALRRAARYGDGFTVPGATSAVYDQWRTRTVAKELWLHRDRRAYLRSA